MATQNKRRGPVPRPKDSFLLRLEPALMLKVKALAEKERRTVTAQMHLMLDEWLQRNSR